jgi:hypothetical protein
MALFNILVDIAARTANLEAGMKRAVDTVEGFQNKVESIQGVMEKAFIGISIASLAETVVSTTEKIDALSREALKAGTSVEGFQGLAYAAKMTDVSTEALSTAFKFLNKNIGEAAAGSSAARDKFSEIGIRFEQFRELKPEEQFKTLAEAISRIKDPAEKVRAEISLLGRSGTELAPMFEGGAAGIEKFIREAKDFGVILSRDQIDTAKEAADKVKELKAAWEGFIDHLAVKAAPILTNIATSMRRLVGGSTDLDRAHDIEAQMAKNAAALEAPAGQTAGAYRNNLLQQQFDLQTKLYDLRRKMREEDAADAAAGDTGALGKPKHRMTADELNALLPGFNTAAIKGQEIYQSKTDEFWKKLDDATKTGSEKQETEVAEFVAKLDALFEEGKISPEQYVTRYLSFWDKLQESTRTGGEKVEAAYKNFQRDLAFLQDHGQIDGAEASKRQTAYLDDVLKNVEVTHKKLTGKVADFKDTALDYGSATADALQNAFAGFFSGTEKGLGGLVSAFAKAFEQILAQAAASGVMKLLFGALGGADSFFGGIFSGLGFKASGGDVGAGQPYIVGEKGPELFVPNGSGTIVPNGSLRAATGGGGGTYIGTIAPVYNISGLGLSYDQVQALMARNNSDLVAVIRNPRMR